MLGGVSNHYFCQETLGLRAFQAKTGKRQLSRPFVTFKKILKKSYILFEYSNPIRIFTAVLPDIVTLECHIQEKTILFALLQNTFHILKQVSRPFTTIDTKIFI